ncbi:MAG: rod shape-determining protein MreD [Bacilli bacterium]|nr:rod shape-determining protein MreD [Bacilli bacterium]
MEKKDNYLIKCFLVMLICFTLDSFISYFMPFNFSKQGITIVPSVALMMYLLLVKSIEGVNRYFFGAICGLYYSIVYSNSLAIYILIYVIIAFVRTYIVKIEEFSFLEAIVLSILTIFAQESVVYWLMKITNTTNMMISQFLLMRVLPTLICNVILFAGVFFAYKKIRIEVA